MSLFTLNRYLDEENPEVLSNMNAEAEAKKLAKVLRKAEKRKKAREAAKERKAFRPSKKRAREDDNTVTSTVDEPPEKSKEIVKFTNEKIPQKSFQIIGMDNFTIKLKVKPVLPLWITTPIIISSDLNNLQVAIDDLAIIDILLRMKLKESGMEYFFPVQSAVIPFFLRQVTEIPYWGRDICISAPTGSGKTLAYVIPIVQALRHRVVPYIRALIILPVKELAAQVCNEFKKFTKLVGLKVMLLSDDSYEEEKARLWDPKLKRYQCRTDVVITTPGRLVEHCHGTVGFSLKNLRFLVLDEADRMLNQEQNDWLYHLEQHFKAEKKTFRLNNSSVFHILGSDDPPPMKILASATLTQDPEKLHRIGLFKPMLFSGIASDADISINTETRVGNYTLPDSLNEEYIQCSVKVKPLVVYHIITTRKLNKVLIFANSAKETQRLSLLLSFMLKRRYKVAELCGALKQGARNKALEKFANGEHEILVTTDALARGVDIPNVDMVILYNASTLLENYVHRVGRTGRAGKSGTALSILTVNQKSAFLKMFGCTRPTLRNVSFKEDVMAPSEKKYQKALTKVKERLEQEKRKEQARKKKIKQGKNKKA